MNIRNCPSFDFLFLLIELPLEILDIAIKLLFQEFLPLVARPLVIGQLPLLFKGLVVFLVSQPGHFLLQKLLFNLETHICSFYRRIHL